MNQDTLSVRELQKEDIDSITTYWLESDNEFLKAMGVDLAKIPAKEQWEAMLYEQLRQPIEEKKSYCIIWQADGKAVGHSNINKIIFGQEAYMHLHLWNTGLRKKGWGTKLVRMTLPLFFEKYKLKNLYCEPNALNPAPNKTLEKAGFEFLKSYVTTPGWINFEQPVNCWSMSYERYKTLFQ